MPDVYRGMVPDDPGPGPLPQDDNANALGVRVVPPSAAADVETYLENEVPWVNPVDGDGEPQGISVATGSGCNLPPHRRPKGASWNGTGKAGLQMWQLDSASLVPNQLAVVPAPLVGQPHHAVIAPAVAMSLATYRGFIAATAGDWVVAAPADPACAGATALEGGRTMKPQVDQLVTAVADGDHPAELVTALLAANAAGTSAAEIVDGIEAAVVRAEAAGNEEGAEALRGVLDRISGYCAPAHRIPLA